MILEGNELKQRNSGTWFRHFWCETEGEGNRRLNVGGGGFKDDGRVILPVEK